MAVFGTGRPVRAPWRLGRMLRLAESPAGRAARRRGGGGGGPGGWCHRTRRQHARCRCGGRRFRRLAGRVLAAVGRRSEPDVWLRGRVGRAWYGGPVGALAQNTGHSEEEWLAGRGTAARLFPRLTACCAAAPAQVTLDTAARLSSCARRARSRRGPGSVRRCRMGAQGAVGLRLTTRSRRAGHSSGLGEPARPAGPRVLRHDLALGDDVLIRGRTGRAGQAQGSARRRPWSVGGTRRPSPKAAPEGSSKAGSRGR